ncbi:MAG: site-specific integrase [Fuerstiella sp.]
MRTSYGYSGVRIRLRKARNGDSHFRAQDLMLLDDAREHIRTRHLALRTERAYLSRIERFLRHEKSLCGEWKHPSTMGSVEVNRLLTYLANERHVAANTQIQALSALLLLFREVLKVDINVDAVRAKHSDHLPVVLSPAEV